MPKLYHASSYPKISKENISIEHSGSAKNGDNQAAGIHFSTVEEIAQSYLNSNGTFLTATINTDINSLPDFYNDSDYFPYLNILINYIGEDFIDNLIDEIEDRSISYFNYDLKHNILKALIFYHDDLIEEIKEHYDITKDIIDKLNDILSNSFELDESNYSHQECYKMLSATLGSRIKASQELIKEGIYGFKYKQGDIEKYNNEWNLCILDTSIIKIESIQKPKKIKSPNI